MKDFKRNYFSGGLAGGERDDTQHTTRTGGD